MARNGTTFEKTVANLEKLLSGFNELEITHDKRVEDKVTGGLRQIDVWISGKLGSHTINVMIECRNREKVEDVTWVEQVKTKRDDVRADKAVIISSNSFSNPAMIKAKHYNIAVRTLVEIKLEDVLSWMIDEIVIVQRIFSVRKDTIKLLGLFRHPHLMGAKPTHSDLDRFHQASQSIRNYNNKDLLYDVSIGKNISLHNILRRDVRSENISRLLLDENPLLANPTLSCIPPIQLLDAPDWFITDIECTYEISETRVNVKPKFLSLYTEFDGNIEQSKELLRFVKCEGEINGKRFALTLNMITKSESANYIKYSDSDIDPSIFDLNGDGSFTVDFLFYRKRATER